MLTFNAFEGSPVFKFIDPDTGYKYEATTRKDLVTLILRYRVQNQLPPLEELNIVLDNYLCSLPENLGKCHPLPKLKRGLLAYVKGGLLLLQNIMFKDFVSQEEADRRALICTTCPANVFLDRGPFIKWSDEVAEASVGDRKSKYHDALGNCASCSCCLRGKVWYTGPFNLTASERFQMEKANPSCWQIHIKE